MKNPYKMLEIPQDATKKEINKAKFRLMKEKKHSLNEIRLAEKQLLNPSKRLVADFIYPSKIKAKRPKLIPSLKPLTVKEISELNPNAFDTF